MSFADEVALAMAPTDERMEIGCHFWEGENGWEVSVFGSKVTAVGGKHDGKRRSLPFVVDIPAVMHLFTDIRACRWQALSLAPDDELGPHFSIEGTYEEVPVVLRILANPPRRLRQTETGPTDSQAM